MAKAKKAAKTAKLPKGFSPMRSNLAGFMALEVGNTAQGIYRGSFRVKSQFSDDGKAVYRIELTHDGCVTSDGEVLSKGQVVGLDEKGWTKKLGECEEGREVFVRYEGKAPDETKKQGKKTIVVKRGAHQFTIGVADAD